MELGSIAKEGGTNMEEVVVTKGDTSPACMAEVSFLTPPPPFSQWYFMVYLGIVLIRLPWIFRIGLNLLVTTPWGATQALTWLAKGLG